MTSPEYSIGLRTSFGTELRLSGLLRIEDSLRKRLQTYEKSNAHNTVDTTSYSEGTFSSLEGSERGVLKSILKSTGNGDSTDGSIDMDRLRAWIEQPIPSSFSLRKDRRRLGQTLRSSSPSKYDSTKTRFPGRTENRIRQEPKIRGPRRQKTVEEQWVRTCKFMWWIYSSQRRIFHHDSCFASAVAIVQ